MVELAVFKGKNRRSYIYVVLLDGLRMFRLVGFFRQAWNVWVLDDLVFIGRVFRRQRGVELTFSGVCYFFGGDQGAPKYPRSHSQFFWGFGRALPSEDLDNCCVFPWFGSLLCVFKMVFIQVLQFDPLQ